MILTTTFSARLKGHDFGLPMVKRMIETLGRTMTFENLNFCFFTFFVFQLVVFVVD
jgi:hypothetical protein